MTFQLVFIRFTFSQFTAYVTKCKFGYLHLHNIIILTLLTFPKKITGSITKTQCSYIAFKVNKLQKLEDALQETGEPGDTSRDASANEQIAVSSYICHNNHNDHNDNNQHYDRQARYQANLVLKSNGRDYLKKHTTCRNRPGTFYVKGFLPN